MFVGEYFFKRMLVSACCRPASRPGDYPTNCTDPDRLPLQAALRSLAVDGRVVLPVSLTLLLNRVIDPL
jgi:hypothetical protein